MGRCGGHGQGGSTGLGHGWNDLDDSDIPHLVDVSVLRDIRNPALVDHIQRAGVVLYERPNPPPESL
ncbi:MAG: hypothetical protein HY902_05635 [Deltaproteobacteria bacterium]|nr:hypothetical protein [Deltaproteobacteria bacterium]